jgi:hypothetical protein
METGTLGWAWQICRCVDWPRQLPETLGPEIRKTVWRLEMDRASHLLVCGSHEGPQTQCGQTQCGQTRRLHHDVSSDYEARLHQSFWSEEQCLRCCQTKLLANHQHQQSRDRVGLWYLGESQGCGTKPALQWVPAIALIIAEHEHTRG